MFGYTGNIEFVNIYIFNPNIILNVENNSSTPISLYQI